MARLILLVFSLLAAATASAQSSAEFTPGAPHSVLLTFVQLNPVDSTNLLNKFSQQVIDGVASGLLQQGMATDVYVPDKAGRRKAITDRMYARRHDGLVQASFDVNGPGLPLTLTFLKVVADGDKASMKQDFSRSYRVWDEADPRNGPTSGQIASDYLRALRASGYGMRR